MRRSLIEERFYRTKCMIQEPTIVEPTKAANILAAEIARARGVSSERVPMAAEVNPAKRKRATR
jgi:hypothetical protein